ncbi:MAG: sigma-70 family RNA polymerase sigma factor [Bacteroidota bacterium]
MIRWTKESGQIRMFEPMSVKRPPYPSSAFEELFTAHYQIFFGLGFRMCRDRELTKDLIQSFFLELWEKQIWQRDIQDMAGYLYRSFYRKVLEELRKQRAHPQLEWKESHDDSQPDFETLLVEVQQAQELQQQLRSQMERLPPQQRKALEMRFLQGFDYQEIAQYTGKSKQTIYNQVHAAIASLRKWLGSHSAS